MRRNQKYIFFLEFCQQNTRKSTSYIGCTMCKLQGKVINKWGGGPCCDFLLSWLMYRINAWMETYSVMFGDIGCFLRYHRYLYLLVC